jgi:hypothetical protein
MLARTVIFEPRNGKICLKHSNGSVRMLLLSMIGYSSRGGFEAILRWNQLRNLMH